MSTTTPLTVAAGSVLVTGVTRSSPRARERSARTAARRRVVSRVEVREYDGRTLGSVETSENRSEGPRRRSRSVRLEVTGCGEARVPTRTRNHERLRGVREACSSTAWRAGVPRYCGEGSSCATSWTSEGEAGGAHLIFSAADLHDLLPRRVTSTPGHPPRVPDERVTLPPASFPFQVVAEDKWATVVQVVQASNSRRHELPRLLGESGYATTATWTSRIRSSGCLAWRLPPLCAGGATRPGRWLGLREHVERDGREVSALPRHHRCHTECMNGTRFST